MKRIEIKTGQVWVTRRGKNTSTPSRQVLMLYPQGKHPNAPQATCYFSGGLSPRSCLVDSFKRWIARHDAKPTRTRRPRTLVLR